MACPILEARLRISDVFALRKIIGEAASDDPNLEHSYVLDIDELDAVVEELKLKEKVDGRKKRG